MLKNKKILKYGAAILFWIIFWQVAASAANKELLIALPTPVTVVKVLLSDVCSKAFYVSVLFSVLRVITGFLAAVIIGTVCGILSNTVHIFYILFSPILKIIRAVPVASFVMLIFLWMKRETVPTVISFLTVLPVVWTNVSDGIRAADKPLIEMAKLMGMKKFGILRHIILPAATPFIESALSTGIGFAWKSGVAAEVICRTPKSLGEELWIGKSSIDYDEVFAVTFIVIILSMIFEHGISFIMKRRLKDDNF